MSNARRFCLLAVGLTLSSMTLADNCYDLYALPESKFVAAAKNNPTTILSTLNQCVMMQSCSSSPNPPLCMQNLYYYDAIATYYSQQAQSSAARSTAAPITPPALTAPATNSAEAAAASMPAPQLSTPDQTQVILPNPAVDGSSPSSDNAAADIYKNIKF